MVEMEGWANLGSCRGLADTDSVRADHIFFVTRGRPKINPLFIQYCSQCPVRVQCLYFAIANNEYGVWGGTTKNQRDLLPLDYRLKIVEKAKREGWFVQPIQPYLVSKPPQVSEIETEFEAEFEAELLAEAG